MHTRHLRGGEGGGAKLEMRGDADAGNSPREAFWQYPGDHCQHHTPVDTVECIVYVKVEDPLVGLPDHHLPDCADSNLGTTAHINT